MVKMKIAALVLAWVLFCPSAFACDCHNSAVAKEVNGAQSFVVQVYSQVFAVDHAAHISISPLARYLAEPLKMQYTNAIKSTPHGKLGPIDFNIFTNAQDIFNGFFVEKIPGQSNAFRVSLFFDDTSRASSSVVMKVSKHGQSWKITDILYDGQGSLSKVLASWSRHKKMP